MISAGAIALTLTRQRSLNKSLMKIAPGEQEIVSYQATDFRIVFHVNYFAHIPPRRHFKFEHTMMQ